LKNSKKCS